MTEARLSIPPNPKEFSKADSEDWYVGTGLIDTCVDTYNTRTYVAHLFPTGALLMTPGNFAEDLGPRSPSSTRTATLTATTATGTSRSGRASPSPSHTSEYNETDRAPGLCSESQPLIDARNILRSVQRLDLTVNVLLLTFLTLCYRPETVESLFLAFRLTGDTKYRDYGWKSLSRAPFLLGRTHLFSLLTACRRTPRAQQSSRRSRSTARSRRADTSASSTSTKCQSRRRTAWRPSG